MNFSNPFIGIIGIIAFVAWAFEYFRFKIKAEIYIPGKSSVSKNQKLKRMILFVVGVVGWSLLVFSSSGPSEKLSINSGSKKLNDLFFVLDLSRSMLAEDFKPNRITKAKEKIQRIY